MQQAAHNVQDRCAAVVPACDLGRSKAVKVVGLDFRIGHEYDVIYHHRPQIQTRRLVFAAANTTPQHNETTNQNKRFDSLESEDRLAFLDYYSYFYYCVV